MQEETKYHYLRKQTHWENLWFYQKTVVFYRYRNSNPPISLSRSIQSIICIKEFFLLIQKKSVSLYVLKAICF